MIPRFSFAPRLVRHSTRIPYSGSCQKACHHLPGSQDPSQIHLGNDHRTCTVGDHSYQSCQQNAQYRLAADDRSNLVLTQDFHQKSDNQGYQKDKEGDLKGMDYGRFQNTAFFAVAVFMFTEIMYIFLMMFPVNVFVLMIFFPFPASCPPEDIQEQSLTQLQ